MKVVRLSSKTDTMETTLSADMISICVPVYNGGKFIAQTLESILSQTYAHFELVIVDNASTDDTAEVVRCFKDPRIRYVKYDKTVPPALNLVRSIECAQYDIVAVYHADDIYLPTIVEKQVAFLKSNPSVGAVFTEANKIDEHGNKIGAILLPKNLGAKHSLSFDEILCHLVRNNYNPFVTPTCMARKMLYTQIPFQEYGQYKYVGDVAIFLRMAEKMDLAILPEPLLNCRFHTGQGSYRLSKEVWDHNEIYDLYDKFISLYPALLSKSDLARYECFKRWDYTSNAIKALVRGDTAAAKGLLVRSLSWSRFFTSFLDVNLFIRQCISIAFFVLTFLGIGPFFARFAIKHRVGYAI